MKTVKASSTFQENKSIINGICPVTFTLEKIGGRWKPLILYHLKDGALRYNQIKKAIPAITEKMLIQHLRELETDKLVVREIKPVVPPHVEYSLSASGKTLAPILDEMAKWGLVNSGQVAVAM